MGVKLSELEEGCALSIRVRAREETMQLSATYLKLARPDAIFISLHCDTTKKISFDNVATDMEFAQDGDLPIIWHNVKVISFKSDYVVQVFADGTKYNRRNSFRVGVSMQARVTVTGSGLPPMVMIKDVSLTGFAVSDRKKEISLQTGEILSVAWEDNGHKLNLSGRLVRIEEHDDYNVFGFEIINVCKDLSSYISYKQRSKK